MRALGYIGAALAGAAACGAASTGAAAADRYAVGQVWEYRTRPGDKGSLLRVQRIEVLPELAKVGPVYHISVAGVHFAGEPLDGVLQHLPVSRETLDASVVRLSSSKAAFPDPSEGIAQWRAAKGGVFTIPLAKIVDAVEQSMRGQSLPPSSG